MISQQRRVVCGERRSRHHSCDVRLPVPGTNMQVPWDCPSSRRCGTLAGRMTAPGVILDSQPCCTRQATCMFWSVGAKVNQL